MNVKVINNWMILPKAPKKEKFVFNELTAIIGDYNYYAQHEVEIDTWLETYNCSREGMVIKFCDDKIKTLFILKWI